MHFPTLLLPLVAAAVTTNVRAHHAEHPPSDQRDEGKQEAGLHDLISRSDDPGAKDNPNFECAALSGLQSLLDLSKNSPLLEDITNNDDSFASKISSQAAAASSSLASITQNTKLVSACSSIKIAATEIAQCVEIKGLQKIVSIADDADQLSSLVDGDASKVSVFEAEATAAESRLSTLTRNATLTSACSSLASHGPSRDPATPAAVVAALTSSSSSNSPSPTPTPNETEQEKEEEKENDKEKEKENGKEKEPSQPPEPSDSESPDASPAEQGDEGARNAANGRVGGSMGTLLCTSVVVGMAAIMFAL